MARVAREQDRLDLLVNNAWGAHETFTPESLSAPFWEQSLDSWDSMFDRGVRNHLISCRAAAPLFIKQKGGLIVTTTFWDRDRYLKGNLFYDLAKAAMNRLAFAVAEELRPHGVTSLAVSPGWMRTEFVLMGHKTDEQHWRERPGAGPHRVAALPGPRGGRPGRRPEGHRQDRPRPPGRRPGARVRLHRHRRPGHPPVRARATCPGASLICLGFSGTGARTD